MYCYDLFGGCLATDISFPDLQDRPTAPADWTLRTVAPTPTPAGGRLLGAAELSSVGVRLWRLPDGRLRLEFDDTGSYELAADGAQLEWGPAPGANGDLVRIDVINRVLPLALHESGALCLHGSAVSLAEGTIGFLAPKFHGKSTLALALTTGGAGRLVTDDTLVVEPGEHPRVRPGVHAVRLWGDSAERLAGDAVARGQGPDGKRVVLPAGEDRLEWSTTPLAALYLLRPVRAEEGRPPVTRTALSPVGAAISLLGQSRLGELLGGPESAVLLDRAVALANRVPVYELSVIRDIDQLDAVIAQLRAWHSPEAATVHAPLLPR